MDNERDSLGGFRLRIAAFDAGCANAAAEQDINREKGWWAMPTLHIAIAVIIHSFDPTRTIALAIRSVDRADVLCRLRRSSGRRACR